MAKKQECNDAMYEIHAGFKGLVHMMHDRFADPTETEKPTKKKKKGRNEADVLGKLHHDKKGVYVPADNIRMMIIGNKLRKGAAEIQGSYIETKKGTEYRNMAQSSIWVIGPNDPDKVYVDPKRKTYDIVDARPFVNSTKTRSMAYRPIIKLPWSLDFIIHVTDPNIDESKVRQFFDVAGLRCGCCAYGPKFGRCMIYKWQVKT